MWCLGKKRGGGCSAEGGKFGQPCVKYGAARPRQGKLRGTRDSLHRERYCRKRHEYITHAIPTFFLLSFPMENAFPAFNATPKRERRTAYRPD